MKIAVAVNVAWIVIASLVALAAALGPDDGRRLVYALAFLTGLLMIYLLLALYRLISRDETLADEFVHYAFPAARQNARD